MSLSSSVLGTIAKKNFIYYDKNKDGYLQGKKETQFLGNTFSKIDNKPKDNKISLAEYTDLIQHPGKYHTIRDLFMRS